MTQEEKQLLLRDLCGRLLYGVFVEYDYGDGVKRATKIHGNYLYLMMLGKLQWKDFKPYLRPMSSMTEAEIEELKELMGTDEVKQYGFSYSGLIGECFGMMYDDCSTIVDYLNSHYLDYRGLIPMGLALVAPYGMYTTDQNKKP